MKMMYPAREGIDLQPEMETNMQPRWEIAGRPEVRENKFLVTPVSMIRQQLKGEGG